MRKALVVGINDYTDCPLNGCCNDADEVSSILINYILICRILHIICIFLYYFQNTSN